MTIDRIYMIEVVQHSRVQISELGNQGAEYARTMHRLQGLRHALPSAQNSHQRHAGARIVTHRVVDQFQVVAHQLISAARQLDAMGLAIGENRYQVERLALEE